MPKKLPYGQSDFAKLIERNYVYVDKTRFVELLEDEHNTYQFFLRPRRFGKSLFLSVLENYYDINAKSKFDALFGNFYIGKKPTPEQGKYAVMRFDFSGLDTDNHEDFRNFFSKRVEDSVVTFFEKYERVLPHAERDIKYIRESHSGVDALNTAYSAANRADIPVFVIIDEYDHFANNMIARGRTYRDDVRAGGLVRVFYESLKIGTGYIVKRIFITGVSPMMMDDMASGFNMADNLTLLPKYNEMFGFTREEVEWLMREADVDGSLIKVDMETYYNGYVFSKYSEKKVYNSQMVLYLFSQILQLGRQPDSIIDPNLRTDYGRLRRLVENERNREALLQIMKNGKITSDLIERFSVDELNREEYFVSLLFYLGMLTIGGKERGTTRLLIPNYSVKTLYWEYAISYTADTVNTENDAVNTAKLSETIKSMAYDGDIKPYIEYFTENFLKRLSNRDLQRFDEKYIKVMLLSTMFISGVYLPVSEDENVNGYTDVYLQKHPAVGDIVYEYVLEIKYVKTGATEAETAAKLAEAKAQIEKYKKDARFAGRDDIKFAALVFKGKGDVIVAV